MMLSRGLLGILYLSISFSSFLWGNMEIKTVKINGFDVHLFNTKQGDKIAFSYFVPVGSWHDEAVRMAGRAHLWEHVVHCGSKKNPGHGTHNQILQKIGGQHNASTYHHHTRYYWSGPEDKIDQVLDLYGSMLSDPEWNVESFEAEKKVVMNEALEYQNRDNMALSEGQRIYLLPNGHRLRSYDIGTQDQLRAMTLDDLKALYYSNYVPGRAHIFISGNLTEEKTQEIIGSIKRNFHAPVGSSNEPHAREIEFPPFVDEAGRGKLHWVNFGTTKEARNFYATLSLKEKVHPFVLKILSDYIDMELKNSLIEKWKLNKRILSGGMYPYTVNNLQSLNISIDWSEEGAKYEMEFLEEVFKRLREIRDRGMRIDLLQYFITKNTKFMETLSEDPSAVNSYYQSAMASGIPFEEAVNTVSLTQAITSEDIQKAAAAIDIENLLVASMRPEIKGEPDPIFNRPHQIFRDKDKFERLKKIWNSTEATQLQEEIEVPNIAITLDGIAPVTDKKAVILPSEIPGTTLALEQSTKFIRSGVEAKVALPMRSVEDSLYLKLFLIGFFDKHRAELDFFENVKTRFSFDEDYIGLGLSLLALPEYVNASWSWFLQSLATYEPTMEQLEKAKESTLSSLHDFKDSFTAQIAAHVLRSLLVQRSNNYQIEEALKNIDLSKTKDRVRSFFSRGDIYLSCVGRHTPSQTQRLAAEVRKLFPNPLTEEDRSSKRFNTAKLGKSLGAWQALDASKDEKQIGWVRAFPVPSYDSKEYAFMPWLSEVLYHHIHEENRTKRKLGYIHGSGRTIVPGEGWLYFIGQTEGIDQAAQMPQGWEVVVNKLQKGEISDEELNQVRENIIREHYMSKNNALHRTAYIQTDMMMTNEPNYSDFMMERLKRLTPSQLRAFSRDIISQNWHLDVITSRNPTAPKGCAGELIEVKKVKEMLASH